MTRLFERIQDFEKRVLKRRGQLSRPDAEAQLTALTQLLQAPAPFRSNAAEALLEETRAPIQKKVLDCSGASVL